MSLFPAYSETTSTTNEGTSAPQKVPEDIPSTSESAKWLENCSFATSEIINHQPSPKTIALSDTDSTDTSEKSSADEAPTGKSSKKHKKRKKEEKEAPTVPAKILEFANEDFYVDKGAALQYKSIRTLHKPACPRYRHQYPRCIGWRRMRNMSEGAGKLKSSKRYYRQSKKSAALESPIVEALDENEYTLQLGKLNRRTMEAPSELQPWLELIELQQRNPYKWSRLLLAEKTLDLVQRALVYHPRNEKLYRIYIDTVNATYPSFEVSKMFDRLLAKDPYNYTLWTAQIMTTQGSMARCVVPDVLRIYERCMQKMHHAQKQTGAEADQVMLKLFNNCALFLRQAGLYEQFFALVRLALELNVSTAQFGDFAPLAADQRTLIEYEELVLQSGLPMNEIWLRVEQLRQGFNFLPCPPNAADCADPQRVVFNEDVCHYIYPLQSRDNAFYLMLLILRLLKLPFVQCDGLARKFCARVVDMGDSDAIEDVLAVFLRRSYALPPQPQEHFLGSVHELARQMAVSPTFLNNTIGHEIYARCLSDFLTNCALAHSTSDERKRIIFLLLWCRLERLLLLLQKCGRKLQPEYVRAGRARFKGLLQQPPNRNALILYTEFALYEYEALDHGAGDDLGAARKLFENIIATHAASDESAFSSDLCHIYAVYAEILCGRGQHEEATQVLASYALAVDIRQKAEIGAGRKLAALQQLTARVDRQVAVERNVEVMVLEQYLLPDHTVCLLKMLALLQCLLGQQLEALTCLDRWLAMFRRETSDRHCFLRENVQELYVTVLQLALPAPNCALSRALVSQKVFAALAEFPRNLFLLQRCSMLVAVPWYKVRVAMLSQSTPSILSVVFLIAAARFRFVQTTATPTPTVEGESNADVRAWDRQHAERVVRNRILNLFQMLTPQGADSQRPRQSQTKFKALQRNALFWRFYLRCLSDQSTAFETSKKCLLTALDECPWSKALYMDGATYVPQELSHLQDLIIEKQLRIYALPEELEILRQT